jgi:hypothetical protein
MFDLDLAREIADLKGHVGSEQSLPIPMFHSVYHDYHISYGTVSTFKPPTSSERVFVEHFYYAEALTLVGGGQLMISGVFAGDDENEQFKPFFDYMETLTRARKAARNHFNLGRWLPPPQIACESVDIKYKDEYPPKLNIPVIAAGCFEYEDEVVVALVNHRTTPHNAQFQLTPGQFERSDEWTELVAFHPGETTTPSSADHRFDMECPALSATLIKISWG